MYKLSIILVLNYFGMISTSKTFYYQAITTQEAVKSLVEIQHSHALPLVLMIEKDSTELRHPQYLEKIFVDKARIINRTQFGRRKNPSKQFYFCPQENSTEKCLVHKEFQQLEPLQCTKEVIPILEKDEEKKCGFKGVGTFYSLFYQICPDQEPYDFGNKELRERVYEFCYDTKRKKLLSITHAILHPKLLSSEELYWERNVEYSMENTDEFTILNQNNLGATIAEKTKEPNVGSSKYQSKKQKTGKNVYKVQKLVPSEDMAFALWRKYTFRHLNTELQHEDLIGLWNEMNSYIRLHIENLLLKNSNRIENFILTGVFDLDSKPREDGQLANMWAKLVYFLTKDNDKQTLTATVILMNNFIDTTMDFGTSSDSQEKTIDYYCSQDDFCAESLKVKFKDVGGRVRCCSLTKQMAQLFDAELSIPFSTSLRIPGIHKMEE